MYCKFDDLGSRRGKKVSVFRAKKSSSAEKLNNTVMVY